MSGEAAEKEFTEAELTGEETGITPPLPTPITPEVTPVATPVVPEVPVKVAEVVPGKEPAPPTPLAPTKDDRTVPLAALHEERRARQDLARKLEELQAKLTSEPRKTPAELILEDPENAMTVLMQEITDLRGEIARTNMERDINTAVPNFLELAPQMEELLLGEGLSEETIRNLIGSSGKEAPKFFKVLAKLTSAPNETALRTKLTAELTPTITAAVTKDLMAKFKIVDGGVNLEKLPGSPPDGKLNVNTEEEFAKLTPEQQQAWLSGG